MSYSKISFYIRRAPFIALMLSLPLLADEVKSPLTEKFVISGLNGPALENAKKALKDCLPEEQKDQHVNRQNISECYASGIQLIKDAIKPYGYFSATVHPNELTHHGSTWRAVYTVDAGHRAHISDISIHIKGPGKSNNALLKMARDFPLRKGDAFESPKYETARDQLLATAAQQGWLEAAYTQREVIVDTKQNTAQIILVIETGPRFYFGAVTFCPNPFNKDFLQRFIQFKQNEPFSSEKLLKLQENLASSGYFKDVIVTPRPEKAVRHNVPMTVTLEPPRAKRYLLGLGYGTFTGPRTTLGIDYRRVGGSGHHFSIQARYSTVLQGLSSKYYIPGKNPLTDQFVLGADAQKFVPENGRSFSVNLTASKIVTHNEWQHTFSLHFLNERFQVEMDPSESSRLFYPDYSVGWVSTDNLMNPNTAKIVRISLRGANDKILSYTNFIQTEIKVKRIFSPTEISRISVRGELGYTVVNDLARLPLTLRYFTGGLNSVRGYPYSSIGPGRYLETASIEYQHRLIGDLSGAVFYDLGTATDHLNENIMKGTGVGFIYHSIVGPLRLYVARALSKPGHPFRIEFSLGPDL